MGIKLQQVQAKTMPSTKHGEPKPHYKNSDLPFEDRSRDLEIWRTKVIPAIIDWGGSRADPFAVVAHPKFRAVVEHFWDQSFSTVEAIDAVHAVVSTCMPFQVISDPSFPRLRQLSGTGGVTSVNVPSVILVICLKKSPSSQTPTSSEHMLRKV
jgi:hypothetical protein